MTATRRTVTTSRIMMMTMTAMKMAKTMAMMRAIMMIFKSYDILKQKHEKKNFSMTYLKMIMIESFKIRIL